ncbi:MAG: GrpB family protein [Kiritimatiellae bacterium]|nr:GrpB family protein [Kiritimatiellia bacterium]
MGKDDIGLEEGTVRLVPYSKDWPRLFSEEEKRLRAGLRDHLVAIEHVGSTAVAGLQAKPIIDISVAIRSLSDLEACIAILEKQGYSYKGEYGLPGRHFFIKGEPATTHHLHLVQHDSEHRKAWLRFRDYLRTHHEVAREYHNLKKDLARRFARDRDSYTKAKTEFILKTLRVAGGDT